MRERKLFQLSQCRNGFADKKDEINAPNLGLVVKVKVLSSYSINIIYWRKFPQ